MTAHLTQAELDAAQRIANQPDELGEDAKQWILTVWAPHVRGRQQQAA